MDAVIADKAAGLYGSFYAAGTISDPLVGSMVFEMLKENWSMTNDVFAALGTIYSLIFLVFNVLPDITKER